MLKRFMLNVFGSVFFWTLVALGLPVASGAFMAEANWPNAAATVSGIAVESAREVDSTTVTPVEYVFDGEARTGLAPVTATVGDTVTFGVTAEGEPARNTSVFTALFLGVMTAAFVGILTLLATLLVGGDLMDRRQEQRERRRRARSWYSDLV